MFTIRSEDATPHPKAVSGQNISRYLSDTISKASTKELCDRGCISVGSLSPKRIGVCSLVSGTAKGASGKGLRQKTSKIVKKCQNYFRHFSTFSRRAKIVKKRQKYFRHFLTIFARHQFSGPFWGALTLGCKTCAVHKVSARMVWELWAADPSRCPRVAISLACYRIGFGPPARNRKNLLREK